MSPEAPKVAVVIVAPEPAVKRVRRFPARSISSMRVGSASIRLPVSLTPNRPDAPRPTEAVTFNSVCPSLVNLAKNPHGGSILTLLKQAEVIGYKEYVVP